MLRRFSRKMEDESCELIECPRILLALFKEYSRGGGKLPWHGSKPTGEQPLFSVEAYVYEAAQTDQGGWDKVTDRPVLVHFYNDIVRRTYRVLCVDGSRPFINCSLTKSMVVTKVGPKFVQWLDPRAAKCYGLGFDQELEMELFIKKFMELQLKIGGVQDVGRGIDEIDPVLISALKSTAVPAEPSYSEASFADSEETILRSQVEDLKSALFESSVTAKEWDDELEKIKKQNMELKAKLEAFMLMNNRGAHFAQPPQVPTHYQAEFDHPIPYSGAGELVPLLPAAAYLHSHGPFEQHRQRGHVEGLLPAGGATSMAEQLQFLLEQNKAHQHRLHSCETCRQKTGNRQAVLQMQKAIGEKLTEALALHKALSSLL